MYLTVLLWVLMTDFRRTGGPAKAGRRSLLRSAHFAQKRLQLLQQKRRRTGRMDSQGKGAGLGGGLGGGSEEGSVDDGLRADCGPVSGEATQVVGAADGAGAQALGPPTAPAPTAAELLRGQPLEFCMTVHFQSFLEADITRRKLLPVAERLGCRIQKEIRVNDTNLTIRLMADDWNLLRIATITMVTQLVGITDQNWYRYPRNPKASN